MPTLIVALDVPELALAQSLVERLDSTDVMFKIGYEAYYRYGAEFLPWLAARNLRVMLDLKLHDIPRTVAAAVRRLLVPGMEILTVHALGGEAMVRAAVEAAADAARERNLPLPSIFAVTVLTSIAEIDLSDIGLSGGMGENVVRLAALARNAGAAGVVCSAHEAAELKSFFGTDFAALCPGIRPAGSPSGDQARTMTPAQAVAAGADYLVVGRPITEAADPVGMVAAIIQDMNGAHKGDHATSPDRR